MARSDAHITIVCDQRGDEMQVELTDLAGGGWDDRDVDSVLTREGWVITGGGEICTVCAEGDDE